MPSIAGQLIAAGVAHDGARAVTHIHLEDVPGARAARGPATVGRGAATTLAVRRDGLVQAVEVPAGPGVLTWSYRPPGYRVGFALSAGSAALLILLVSGLLVFRSARRRELAWDPGEPSRVVEPMVRNG